MYSQLIKRSRLYLELKNQYYDSLHFQRNKQQMNYNDQQHDKDDNKNPQQFVKEFLQSYNKQSLLLTKDNLIQLIKYLHQENIMLSGLKNSHNPICKIESQQIQENKQKIQQFKLRKQLYEKQLKQKTKIITDLKVKVQACQQYLQQVKRPNINTMNSNHNNNKVQKKLNNNNNQPKDMTMQIQQVQGKIQLNQKISQELQQLQQQQSAMLQLVKGFELLKQKNTSFISLSSNFKDNIKSKQQKETNLQKQNSFINSLKRMKKQQDIKINKNQQDSSSSIIETSSFMANYYRPYVSGLSSSIREILQNGSDNQKQFQDIMDVFDQNIIKQEDSQLQTERKKNDNIKQTKIYPQNKNLIRDIQNKEKQKIPKSDSQQTSNEKQQSLPKNKQQQSVLYTSAFKQKSKPTNFLNVLNKFNKIK